MKMKIRKINWRWLPILAGIVLGLLFPMTVPAAETDDYLRELNAELDYKEWDTFMEEVSFSDRVGELMQEGVSSAWGEKVFSCIKTALAGEITKSRRLLLEIVLLAFCFSILKNFAGAFQASYISDLCFLLVYCVMVVLLLQSFLLFQEIVSKSLESCVEFMKVMVPTFCLSMMFASNTASAMDFTRPRFW